MPPKPKFTKEEIVKTALLLVSEKGIDALTARDLASKLDASPRPIFTIFNNMEEVIDEVKILAMDVFNNYANKKIEGIPVFKQIGINMINFAINEPKLYQLLFMTERKDAKTFEELFYDLGEIAELSIKTIINEYGFSHIKAMELFKHLWIYTFGIGALCATKSCSFTKDDINTMLSEEFISILNQIKAGEEK